MKVLNVAEKPSVAKEISNILSSGQAQRVRLRLLHVYVCDVTAFADA